MDEKRTVTVDEVDFQVDGWYVEAEPDTHDTPGHDAYFNLIEVYHKGVAFSNFIHPQTWDEIARQAQFQCEEQTESLKFSA